MRHLRRLGHESGGGVDFRSHDNRVEPDIGRWVEPDVGRRIEPDAVGGRIGLLLRDGS